MHTHDNKDRKVTGDHVQRDTGCCVEELVIHCLTTPHIKEKTAWLWC